MLRAVATDIDRLRNETLQQFATMPASKLVDDLRTEIIWAPGGSGDAQNFLDVAKMIGGALHPLLVYVDRRSAGEAELSIPAGRWDLEGTSATTLGYGDSTTNTIYIEDGAVLLNPGEMFRSVRVVARSSAPVVEFVGLPDGKVPVVVDAVVGRQLGREGAHAIEVALHHVRRADRVREARVLAARERQRGQPERPDPPQTLDLRTREQPRDPPFSRAGERDQAVNGIAQDHRREGTRWRFRRKSAGAASPVISCETGAPVPQMCVSPGRRRGGGPALPELRHAHPRARTRGPAAGDPRVGVAPRTR